MGGANKICSDKTGTLTKNKMTWSQIWCGVNKEIPEPDGTEVINTNLFCDDNQHMELIRQAVACNTSGTLNDGDATEIAMLKFIVRCETDYLYYRDHYMCHP